VVVSILGAGAVILGLINQRKIRKVEADTKSISVQVDGRLSELLARQAQLLAALHAGGVEVPNRPPEPGEVH
jgi:hypothetical protein